jgi:hypothetical protein
VHMNRTHTTSRSYSGLATNPHQSVVSGRLSVVVLLHGEQRLLPPPLSRPSCLQRGQWRCIATGRRVSHERA